LRRFPGAKFLRMARDIAASHHERWDGQGYPDGLKGEQIPLCSRIVALADVYDALTSKRVYKNAFAHEVARGIIIKDSGTHFEPAIVDAFIAAQSAFIAIREQYHEALPSAA
jgi:putative two-component system response regulator